MMDRHRMKKGETNGFLSIKEKKQRVCTVEDATEYINLLPMGRLER